MKDILGNELAVGDTVQIPARNMKGKQVVRTEGINSYVKGSSLFGKGQCVVINVVKEIRQLPNTKIFVTDCIDPDAEDSMVYTIYFPNTLLKVDSATT